MSRFRTVISTMVFASVVGLAVPAAAQDKADEAIKYRQALMKSIGAHFVGIVAILEGKVNYPASHVAAHAEAINVSSRLILDAFKAKVEPFERKTGAKPEIWQEWDRFAAASRQLLDQSANLAQVANGGDVEAIKAQFSALGKLCGSCHKSYRAEDK